MGAGYVVKNSLQCTRIFENVVFVLSKCVVFCFRMKTCRQDTNDIICFVKFFFFLSCNAIIRAREWHQRVVRKTIVSLKITGVERSAVIEPIKTIKKNVSR